MGFKEWWWRRRRIAFLVHRFILIVHDKDPGKEVGYMSHKDDGREVVFFDGKMFGAEALKKQAITNRYGMLEILHPIGVYESAVAIPLKVYQPEAPVAMPLFQELQVKRRGRNPKLVYERLVVPNVNPGLFSQLSIPSSLVIREWLADQAAARIANIQIFGETIKGGTTSLQIYATNLQAGLAKEMFLRGRFRLMMIIIGILAAGLVIVGVAAAGFSSQVHTLCVTIATYNGTQVPVACPVIHATSGHVSSTVTTSISVSTIHVVPPP